MAQIETASDFYNKILIDIRQTTNPVILAGDFNLILDLAIDAKNYLNVKNPNIKSEMRSFKSNDNIHKKEGGSYYVVSANKSSSVTL